MKPAIDAKFKHHYQTHLQHLTLKGLQPKTIEAYSRQALRWMKPRPSFTCPCCGGAMKIVRTRIPSQPRGYPPDPMAGAGAM